MRYRYYYEKQSRMCQETPLHMAARSGNVQVAQLLVSHGAEVNALNLDDLTPLVIAGQEGKQAGPDPARSPKQIIYYIYINLYIFTLYIYGRGAFPGTRNCAFRLPEFIGRLPIITTLTNPGHKHQKVSQE